MVQVIPNWLVSGDDLVAIAPKPLEKPIRFLEDSCCLQRMSEETDGSWLEMEMETEDQESRHISLADNDDDDDNDDGDNREEEKKEDNEWEDRIRSINYTFIHDEDPKQFDTSSVAADSIGTDTTPEITNVVNKKVTKKAIINSKEKIGIVHPTAAATPPQVVPTWIVAGDDIAQKFPEPCQSSPFSYLKSTCNCQQMTENRDQQQQQEEAQNPFRMIIEVDSEEMKTTNDDDDNEEMNPDDDHGMLKMRGCVSTTATAFQDMSSRVQKQGQQVYTALRSAATSYGTATSSPTAPATRFWMTMEAPNSQRPGETTHFIDEDMMDLLEAV